jgi:saccharopine dehydrogenase-like NADP-dependent oxidoreductase
MKKIVIIGSGTAGLIAAAMINNYWKDEVSISCYYNANSKNIAVGESTTPLFRLLLAHLGISTEDLLKI